MLSIGQAGENRISFSMAFIDRISTLGRGGFGAVMGYKNLKAVVVKGSGGVNVADRKRYKVLNQSLLDTIRAWPHLGKAQEMGMTQAFSFVPRERYLPNKEEPRSLCLMSHRM